MKLACRFLLMTTGLLLGAGVSTLAQEEADLQTIAAGIKLNQEALRTYSWQSRVSVAVDGGQKKVEVVTENFNHIKQGG